MPDNAPNQQDAVQKGDAPSIYITPSIYIRIHFPFPALAATSEVPVCTAKCLGELGGGLFGAEGIMRVHSVLVQGWLRGPFEWRLQMRAGFAGC